MGMQADAERPDIYGLPVYRVTKLHTERIGDEIHIIHGHEMFGQTFWTHVEIWLASDMIVEAELCSQIAMRPTRQMVRMS